MVFVGDPNNRVQCGCDFVNKIKPEDTTAKENGWVIFQNYDMTITSQVLTTQKIVRMGKNKKFPGFDMTIECYPQPRLKPIECKETDFKLQINAASNIVRVIIFSDILNQSVIYRFIFLTLNQADVISADDGNAATAGGSNMYNGVICNHGLCPQLPCESTYHWEAEGEAGDEGWNSCPVGIKFSNGDKDAIEVPNWMCAAIDKQMSPYNPPSARGRKISNYVIFVVLIEISHLKFLKFIKNWILLYSASSDLSHFHFPKKC